MTNENIVIIIKKCSLFLSEINLFLCRFAKKPIPKPIFISPYPPINLKFYIQKQISLSVQQNSRSDVNSRYNIRAKQKSFPKYLIFLHFSVTFLGFLLVVYFNYLFNFSLHGGFLHIFLISHFIQRECFHHLFFLLSAFFIFLSPSKIRKKNYFKYFF